MRLPDDAIQALWTLYDKSGIRPEYVLPVLYYESTFDPTKPNAAGAPYYGIGQDFGPYLERHGVTPADYLQQTAAQQLTAIVVPRLAALAKHYGTPRSATRVYQANFLPGTLSTVTLLFQPLAYSGSAVYKANSHFDRQNKGAIVLADLARATAQAAAAPDTRAAIARAYELRTSSGPAREPVFGEDYPDPWAPLVLLAAAALFSR